MFAFGPSAGTPTFYEQMFAKAKTSKLAQRTLGALRLTHSFLLLEDDYHVDWEVDRDEELAQTHPHRDALRGPGRRSRRIGPRRGGEPAAATQACISPVQAPARPAGPARRARPGGKRASHMDPVAASPGCDGHSDPRRTA